MKDGQRPMETEAKNHAKSPNAMEILGFYETQRVQALNAGYRKRKKIGIDAKTLAEIIKVVLDLEVTARELHLYFSTKLALVPEPYDIKENKRRFFYYPDDFEIIAPIVTLRKHYHLPLKDLQHILAAVPKDCHHLIVGKQLTPDDLYELAKMSSEGFAVGDLIMAQACQTMLKDLLPADVALQKATEKGGALDEIEERLLLKRLAEITKWVRGGKRRKYIKREAAADIKRVRDIDFWHTKIGRKMNTAYDKELLAGLRKWRGLRR